jgi:hypothetical protein
LNHYIYGVQADFPGQSINVELAVAQKKLKEYKDLGGCSLSLSLLLFVTVQPTKQFDLLVEKLSSGNPGK